MFHSPTHLFLLAKHSSQKWSFAVPVSPSTAASDHLLPMLCAFSPLDPSPSHSPLSIPSSSHTPSYYLNCMLGGALACGATHTLLTPLDVHKCNMQVSPAKYPTWRSGMRTLLTEEGLSAMYKGWLPTLIGYSAQGMLKFGLYEYFKDAYSGLVGAENASKFKGVLYCVSSASAEFFADIALCPMEMVKVKVQTAPVGTWPTEFGQAVTKMAARRVETRFPFGSLLPLWGRQIPYTVSKFYVFEESVGLVYKHWLTRPREEYSKATQLGVTFASGYVAGVACAAVSQPADNIVSQLGKESNKGKSVARIAEEVGVVNLLTRGLGARIVMIGTLTGLQWWVYDNFKTFVGLGTSGGK